MINKIISLFSSGVLDKIAKIFHAIASCVVPIFTFLENKRKDAKEKEQKEELKQFHIEVDEVVDNGTLDDLLDLRR
jgi:dTDP-D-glucose 4,6-dehydratase